MGNRRQLSTCGFSGLIYVSGSTPTVMDHVAKRHNSVFGDIARMFQIISALRALRYQTDLSLGPLQESTRPCHWSVPTVID